MVSPFWLVTLVCSRCENSALSSPSRRVPRSLPNSSSCECPPSHIDPSPDMVVVQPLQRRAERRDADRARRKGITFDSGGISLKASAVRTVRTL